MRTAPSKSFPLLLLLLLALPAAAAPAVNHGLVGVGRINANTFDQLGPNIDTLGGTFSSIALVPQTWLVSGSSEQPVYKGILYGLPDRGFGDGAQDFHPRIQTYQVTLVPDTTSNPAPQTQISFTNLATILLRTADGATFTGYDPDDPAATNYPQSSLTSRGLGHRSLDPEGLVWRSNGDFFISDEYGPFIYHFDPAGNLLETFFPPDAIMPRRGNYPGTNYFTGTNNPTSGRRNNRGLESLSITPDGAKLFAVLQSPVIQDSGADNASRNTRILVFDLMTNSPTYGEAIAQYIYQLTLNGNAATNRQTVVCEIVALNHEEFLVLERDSLGLGAGAGTLPLYKRVVLANLRGASNIIQTGYSLERGAPGQLSLPLGSLPADVKPVTRADFINLIDTNQLARFGLNINTNQDANTMTEKWEGLGLLRTLDGPDEFILFVGNDNDFKADAVYHNGVVVGTNNPTVDSMLLAYRVNIPGYAAPAPLPQPPSVVIAGPTNATLSAPASFTMPVTAIDPDGLVLSVQLYQEQVKIGDDTAFPFQFAVTDLAPGQYNFSAIATDQSGLVTTSAVRTVTVTAENLPPDIALTGPTNASLSAPASVRLTAAATDPDGTVASIEFYAGAVKLATVAGATANFTVTNVGAGSQTYTAVAIDNHGGSKTSAPVTVLVTETNILPTVTMTAPTNGASFTAPANFTLAASAVDADGSILKVQFFRDAIFLGEDASAPYSLAVREQPVGDSTYSAVGIDNQQAANGSASINVRINPATSAPLVLQVLHAADFLAPVSVLDDAPRFSAVVEGLKRGYPSNTTILSAGGNYVPGSFFTASADPAAGFNGVKGRADIMILNHFGVQASAFGNHEFDENTLQVRELLRADPSVNYPGTLFPYLSANLNFSADTNLSSLVTTGGQDWRRLTNKIAASTIITVSNQTIGVVGVTTPELQFISSPGGVTVDTNLVGPVQRAVDALTAQGINKIILLAHLQHLTNEFQLAAQLRDVDIVVGGSSNTLLANPTNRLRVGDVRAGDYPLHLNSATGEPVLLVNTDWQYKYVGRLVVNFDSKGLVQEVNPLSGSYPTDAEGVVAAGNAAPNPAITSLVAVLAGIIDTKDSNRVGRTLVYLNGNFTTTGAEESNLGDLNADANLFLARLVDSNTVVSLKNRGGIRDSIGLITFDHDGVHRLPPAANPRVGKLEGDISQLDIENALPFNNGLTLLSLTAQQLRDALEWGVSENGVPGQFPQVGGIAFSFDPARPSMSYVVDSNNLPIRIDQTGERVRSAVIKRTDGSLELLVENGALVGDSNRLFRVVTVEFMANGGDNYFPLEHGANRMDLKATNAAAQTFFTEGREQHALALYLAASGPYGQRDNPPAGDRRIQNLSVRADDVLVTEIITARAQPSGIELVFTTLPGRHYQVQASSSVTGPWQDVGPGFTGDGGPKTVAESGTGADRRFYRVVQTP